MCRVLPIKKVPYGLIKHGKELVQHLFEAYQPTVLLIEKTDYPGSKRSPYLPKLCAAITALARRRGIMVIEYTPHDIQATLAPPGTRLSKPQLCTAIARHYPQVMHYVPKKPRGIDDAEPHHTSLFMAIALGLAWGKQHSKRK